MKALVMATLTALTLTSLCTPAQAGLLTKGKLIILAPIRMLKHGATGAFMGATLGIYETMSEWDRDKADSGYHTYRLPAAPPNSLLKIPKVEADTSVEL
jgi:hypothetical protein